MQYHGGVHSYYWEELKCDLCKSGLDLNTICRRDGKTMLYLLGIIRPKGKKYLILESDIDCLSKAVHVLDFSVKMVFNVGRKVTNDITVSDISVSRHQSEIEYDPHSNQFRVIDLKSKFGTFIKIVEPLKIEKYAGAL